MAKTHAEIHEQALERFQEIFDFEGNERDQMLDDKIFSVGNENDQWENQLDIQNRQASGRSFITIMRSNQFTDHIKNQQRQNKPSIKISPTDEGAQEEIATRRQGLVRHIQYESKANQARQAGFDDAVDEGRGHWIVKTEHIEGTFNKKITIDPIPNARSVYMDIHRERPDYSDCKYGFVIKPIPREIFEEKYPDVAIENWDRSKSDFWWTEKDVIIAEYYCEMYKTRNLIEVEIDGETRILWEDELKVEKDTLNITQERKVEDPYWMWYKLTGAEIIDEEDLPWKEIPIITSLGKETIVEGEWSCKGLIRDIKAPLRLYNFVSSNEADIIAKAPRAPWVGVEGQFEGHEEEYANSNISDTPYLEYKAKMIGGQPAPPPQRAQYSIDLSNLTQQKVAIIEDIKAITGIYDASIGNRSNETSGVAIRAREAQGNNANYHYIDNYSMAINHEGRVINSALNVVYDTHRTITIMGEDDEEELLEINGENDEGLGEGNFNVTVSVGPSFNTQREEQAAGLIEMSSKSEMIQQIGMGKVIRAQDWSGKEGLADLIDSFVAMQYPALADQLNSKGKNDEIDVLKQQLMQCQQQLSQMQEQGQQLQEALQKADADKQASEAGKIQIEMQKLEVEKQKVLQDGMKIKGELEIGHKQLEIDAMKADLDSTTKLKINQDSLTTDLIKTKENQQIETTKALQNETLKDSVNQNMSTMQDNIKVMVEQATVEIKSREPKETIVTPTGNGDYKAITKDDAGNTTTATVKKVGKSWKVEDTNKG